MSPAEIIKQATEDGVFLALSPSGSMSVKGVQSAVDRWLPKIRQSKAEIVLLLRPGMDGWSAEDWQVFSPGSDGERLEGGSSSIGAVLENDDQLTEAAKATGKVAKDEWGAAAPTLRCGMFEAVQLEGCDARQPDPQLISPSSWFERCAPPAPGELPYDQPCPARRGRIARKDAAFLHFCVSCGAWGAFGYGIFGDRPGRWYCLEHRPSGT